MKNFIIGAIIGVSCVGLVLGFILSLVWFLSFFSERTQIFIVVFGFAAIMGGSIYSSRREEE